MQHLRQLRILNDSCKVYEQAMDGAVTMRSAKELRTAGSRVDPDGPQPAVLLQEPLKCWPIFY
ncbi:MAG: hypothetical protein ACK559_22080, partial [bacterium]